MVERPLFDQKQLALCIFSTHAILLMIYSSNVLLDVFLSVDYVDNLLEMPDETVTQLDPMRTTYTVCHCDNEGEIENEAICSSDKTIACDVLQTKPYQKNTCYAKRKRRSLQTRLAYIPDNFVQHIERQKASNS